MTQSNENGSKNQKQDAIAPAHPRDRQRFSKDSGLSLHEVWEALFSQRLIHRIWRATLLARLVLFWERLWPALQLPLILLGLYVAVSFLGLWQVLGFAGSAVVSIGFLSGLFWSLLPLRKVSWPSQDEGLRRVEVASALPHRPLQSYQDDQAAGVEDDSARVLWEAHQARMRAALKSLRVGSAQSRAFTKDPFALRVLTVMLLILGISVSGSDRWSSLLDPFRFSVSGESIPARIDAWVTPPAYTGDAPVFLTGDTNQLRDSLQSLEVANGSEVLVRTQGSGGFSVSLASDEGTQVFEANRAAEERSAAGALEVAEWRFPLDQSGRLQVHHGSTLKYSWALSVRPDQPPRIRLHEDPEEQLSGSLKLTYVVEDDYRVVSAEAVMSKVPLGDGEADTGRSLVEAPRFSLTLPLSDGENSIGQTFKDLTAHPWAGSEVTLVLVARDEAGQEGYSHPVIVKLPERRFNKPLARAVVEQRRVLAMDALMHPQVIDVLDVLMLAPEVFIRDAGSYLPLRFAYKQLVAAQSDTDLLNMLDVLWTVALTIEDGGLSAAERALREAQEALRRALEEGASEQEIAQLMDNLRKALNDYMKMMAQQMQDNPEKMQDMPLNENVQRVSPQDLDDMMRRMEELAKTGSLEAARELLAQMQQMLENMQQAQKQAPPTEQQKQMMQALDELTDMIDKQRELMEETHRADQNTPNQQDGNPSQEGGEGQKDQQTGKFQQLQKDQRGLSDELQQLLDKLANNGAPANSELDSAGNSMEDAGTALSEQDGQGAVSEQGEALEALRRGAQQLAEQLAGQGNGTGQTANSPLNEDPLGRMRRKEGPEFGSQVKVPDEIEVQRARRILEELRRRLSDPNRPQLELDYLERLLERY